MKLCPKHKIKTVRHSWQHPQNVTYHACSECQKEEKGSFVEMAVKIQANLKKEWRDSKSKDGFYEWLFEKLKFSSFN